MVEDVKEARTQGKFCALPFGYAETLLHGEIRIEVVGTAILVASLISIGSSWIGKLRHGGAGARSRSSGFRSRCSTGDRVANLIGEDVLASRPKVVKGLQRASKG